MKIQHEKANGFCLAILKECTLLDELGKVRYDCKKPGIIFYTATSGYSNNTLYRHIKFGLGGKNVLDYFDIKLYKTSIHVNLKKEYINHIDDLEILLELQNFWS